MNNTDSSRRRFIKQNSLAGFGVMILGGIGSRAVAQNREAPLPGGSAVEEKIGDLSLEQIRDQYKKELFNRFVPDMDSLVIDHEYGGFMCNVDKANAEYVSLKFNKKLKSASIELNRWNMIELKMRD